MRLTQRTYPLTMRVMGRRDLKDVLRIEANSFVHPWSTRDFLEHFENPGSVALVIEQRGLIVAYEVFGCRPPWIELYSCVVRRGFRRQKIGAQMIASLAREVRDGEDAGVLAKVPERNLAAQLFFRSCGFKAVKIIRSYLEDEQDVYVMQYGRGGLALPRSALGTFEGELVPVWEVKHG